MKCFWFLMVSLVYVGFLNSVQQYKVNRRLEKKFERAVKQGRVQSMYNCLKNLSFNPDFTRIRFSLRRNLLYKMIENNNVERAEQLLKANVLPELAGHFLSDGLRIAVQLEHEKLVDLLVSHDALVQQSVSPNGTSLLMCTAERSPSMVARLIHYGASVNYRCLKGDTALHKAVRSNNFDCAEVLLENKADASAANERGLFTPLHIAAHKNLPSIVKLLVDSGANIEARTSLGKRPRDLAWGDSKEYLRDIEQEYVWQRVQKFLIPDLARLVAAYAVS